MVYSNTIERLPKVSQFSNEALLLALVRHSPVGLAILDRQGGMLFANARWSALAGMSEAQAIEQGWLSGVHSDDGDRVLRQLTQMLDEPEQVSDEFRFSPSNGVISWVSVSFVPLCDENDQVYQFLMTLTDITDRKELQTELMRSEMFLDGILENLPAMVFVKSGKNLRFVRVNRACEKLLGLPREELIGKSDYDFFPPEQADFFTSKDREVLASNSEVVISEEPISTPHGELILHTQKSKLSIPDEESEYLLGVSIDVTQFVQARSLVDASEERYRSLVQNIPGTTYRCALDGCWTMEFVSAGILELVGYRPDQIINNAEIAFAELIHPDDRGFVEEQIVACIDRNIPWNIEYRVMHADGSQVFVHERGRAVRNCAKGADNPGPVKFLEGFIFDITEKKNQEAELQKYLVEIEQARARIERQAEELVMERDRAERASKAKSEFLANMSHEIRTPLGGVLGMVQELLDTELNQEQRELVLTAKDSGELLLSVIRDVLDFSKIEAGKLDIEQLSFSPKQLINNVALLFIPQAKERKIDFKVKTRCELPAVLEGDPHRIMQVIINLVGNGIKFTPAMGSVTLEIGGSANTSNAKLFNLDVVVRDSGIGIQEEKLTEIFNAFEQGDSSISRRFGGAGLGLTICSHLVKLMGGELGLYSVVNQGSTFSFSLPLLVGDAQTTSLEETAKDSSRTPTLSRRILVAEDNTTNQKLITRILEHAGHQVSIVNNGEAAVAASKSGDFDLILMDIQMPGMDGLEATQLIRQSQSSKIPIIALTAHALAEHEESSKQAGMDGYLTKPIDKRQLLEMVALQLTTNSSNT